MSCNLHLGSFLNSRGHCENPDSQGAVGGVGGGGGGGRLAKRPHWVRGSFLKCQYSSGYRNIVMYR